MGQVIRTSQQNWLSNLAQAYRLRSAAILVDDAGLGINPTCHTLVDMGKRAKLSVREWMAVVASAGVGALGAWLVVMAVLDPEPYSKVFGAIAAGGVLAASGGFMAIRILTGDAPPRVQVSARGFEISWE